MRVTDIERGSAAADYDITPLLQPLAIRGMRLRNRFVMPGMQRYWCADGAPISGCASTTGAACSAARH